MTNQRKAAQQGRGIRYGRAKVDYRSVNLCVSVLTDMKIMRKRSPVLSVPHLLGRHKPSPCYLLRA